jgi:molecular chaperone GrpE
VTDKDQGTGPAEAGPGQEPVVIRDKRKIDPSGRAKYAEHHAPAPKPAEGADEAPAGSADEPAEAPVTEPAEPATTLADVMPMAAELEALRSELDERTRDLQRVTAEYANYRKRVDRDRALVAEQAIGTLLVALIPVLDDLDRAREHGDLVGPFGAVAEQLTASLAKAGLSGFGEKGDRFDPKVHEAVAHLTSAEVTEPTCVEVMRRGYLLGERLLRPALVAVADPE